VVARGKGQIVVCDLRVSASGSDPIARRFLANLLAWTAKANANAPKE
jgi:hypothetical protein